MIYHRIAQTTTPRKDERKKKLMSSKGSSNQLEADELAHAISGAGAGALSMAVTYPLVTISTKLQSEDRSKAHTGKTQKSAKDIVTEIYKKEGLLGYYSGLESAIYGTAIANFIYYYFYEWVAISIKRVRQDDQLNTVQSIATGAIAGSVTAIASNPIWIANTRMTVTKSDESTLSTLLQIVKENGVWALFDGLKPALVLVSNPVIQYTVFEQLKNALLRLQKKRNQKQVISPAWAFLLGAIGKFIATTATYPYLTLKTRLHLVGDKNSQKLGDDESHGDITMLSEALKIYKKDGLAGFYRGIGYKLVQSILTAAFLFFFKEGLVLSSVKLLTILRQTLALKRNALKSINTN